MYQNKGRKIRKRKGHKKRKKKGPHKTKDKVKTARLGTTPVSNRLFKGST